MSRFLILILAASTMLILGLATSCSPGLQTFDKYEISFKVANSLKLEEYTINIQEQTFRKGPTSYEQGWVMSTEKNFVFMWLKRPEITSEEVRLFILTTPDVFQSASGTFEADISGDLATEQIAGFEITFAPMQFTFPGGKAQGLTALWYCAASGRVMQLIVIHKQPEREMNRFIGSFSCTPADFSKTKKEDAPPQQTTTEIKAYINEASPIMKRHVETTETTNQANRAFLALFSSGNEVEVIKALKTYVDTLEWALNRIDSELQDFKKLIPPLEVRTFHSLMIEGLTKEQYGFTKQLPYYSSVLRYGFGNDKELDDGNALLVEAQKIWLQVQYQLQDLQQKVK